MRYLGVDYGKKYIGLAISEGKLASAYKRLEIRGLEDAVKKVMAVVTKEGVDVMVVGIPESGEAKTLTKKFIRGIWPACRRGSGNNGDQVKVEEADETLTSQGATRLMLELGVGKKKRQLNHITAACLILQQFLDHNRQDEAR